MEHLRNKFHEFSLRVTLVRPLGDDMPKVNTPHQTPHGSAAHPTGTPTDFPTGLSDKKSAGFQSKPGRMARLREGFARLKEKLDTGRAQSQLSHALHRMSVSHRAKAMSDVRRRDQSSSNLPPVQGSNDKQQAIARHGRLLTMIRDTPASGFQALSPEARTQVLSALDVCTGLSDKTSLEGLLMLKECIDGLRHAAPQPASGQQRSVTWATIAWDLSRVDTECLRQAAQFGS
jgi:hypothetical protein